MLGVSEDASPDEVKKAFRALAMKHHPDKKGGDEAKFKEINEAYETLSDDQKKQQYDAVRSGDYAGWWFWNFGQWGGQFGWFDIDLGDLVWDLFGWFGGWRRSRWPNRGQDIILSLSITFLDSYHGLERQVSYERTIPDPDVSQQTCSTCNGSGRVARQARTPFGVMQTQSPCPTCQWAWSEYTKDGSPVSGWWAMSHTESIKVDIPPWILHEQLIKFSEYGNAWSLWWPAWDLYVKVLIESDNTFAREWDNLISEKEISIYDAVLWGKMVINHPDGKLKVTIPKGLQVTDKIKVSGKWFGKGGLLSSRGDLIIIPKIPVPKKLTKADEKLRKQLQSSS